MDQDETKVKKMKYILYRSFGDLDKDIKKHELVAVEIGGSIDEVTNALIKDVAEDLADELDIDIRTVRKIESGQGNIAYDLLTGIIHTLEICPQVLFYVDEADKGMKMDRLYRELLRLPLEDIKMVAESAYKVRRWLDSQTADSEKA